MSLDLKLALSLLSLDLYIMLKMEPSRYTYILPPILYPNGRHYLKFGAHDLSRELRTKESIEKNISRPKQYEYLQEDVTIHYRIGPDPSHVRKLVNWQSSKNFLNVLIYLSKGQWGASSHTKSLSHRCDWRFLCHLKHSGQDCAFCWHPRYGEKHWYIFLNSPNDDQSWLLKSNVDPNHINPNIDHMKPKLGDGLVLAAGGCGHAAKGADEIGETFSDEIDELLRLVSIIRCRGEICHYRHWRRQCKIFASDVNFSRNNTIYNIKESTKYILSLFDL